MPARSTPASTSVARHQFDGTTRPDVIAAAAAAAASSGLSAASSASPWSSRADAVRRGRATPSLAVSSSAITARAYFSAPGSPTHASVVAVYDNALAGSYW